MITKAITLYRIRHVLEKLHKEGGIENKELLLESKIAFSKNYNQTLFILKITVTALIMLLLITKIMIKSNTILFIFTTIISFGWLVITLEAFFASYYARHNKTIAGLEFLHALFALIMGLIPQLFDLMEYLDEMNITIDFL